MRTRIMRPRRHLHGAPPPPRFPQRPKGQLAAPPTDSSRAADDNFTRRWYKRTRCPNIGTGAEKICATRSYNKFIDRADARRREQNYECKFYICCKCGWRVCIYVL